MIADGIKIANQLTLKEGDYPAFIQLRPLLVLRIEVGPQQTEAQASKMNSSKYSKKN